jgi:uncharacterized glyoxalase superfamily protein PhnB
MTSIQPELWGERPSDAVAFYEAAFGATVLHRVGEAVSTSIDARLRGQSCVGEREVSSPSGRVATAYSIVW